MEEVKKTRKKRDLSTFIEGEDKIIEKLKKMQELKKKYILKIFTTIFNDILSNAELLEILDKNKDDKNFQENLSNILKLEIQKYKYNEKSIEEQKKSELEGNNE